MLRQTAPALSLFFLLFIGIVLASPACSGPNKRTKVLQQTLTALNAARDGFAVWNRQHQLALVDKATSREDSFAKVNEYNARKEAVTNGFMVAYLAVSLAATQADEVSLHRALEAAGELYDAIKKLMGGG